MIRNYLQTNLKIHTLSSGFQPNPYTIRDLIPPNQLFALLILSDKAVSDLLPVLTRPDGYYSKLHFRHRKQWNLLSIMGL